MDRLTSMAVFVRAVDLGSFTAAAESLGLSGPMVGKHIRSLEERLGLRLINRTTRSQSLTDFGRSYYDRCRTILAESDAADALAQDQASEPRGRLRIAMPVHFGRVCIAPRLMSLAKRYPQLELELSLSDRFVDLAEDGFDLAIRTGELASHAGLVARRIARQRMVVCAAPSYLRRNGSPRDLEALGLHLAVVYRRSGRVRPWLFPRAGQEPAEFLPRHRIRLDDLDAIADAAEAGMGLAWLPYWLVRHRVEAGRLRLLLPAYPPFLYDCHALWLQTRQLPAKLRLVIDDLAAALPPLME
jgi:DNA-binding transcriptional LysR family regulator